MGVSTFLVGLLPVYDQAGVLAPVLVTLLRFAQGIGVGGEWGGSVLLATEWGKSRGGRRGFLAAMQARCAELGCADSTWRDPAGLDAPGHRASPADLARVGAALLERPFLARTVATSNYRFRWPDGHVQIIDNHNKLVRYRQDPGAIGIKTGYTSKAKGTLVAAERRGGRTLIAVVLGTDDIYGQARALFAYGFKVRARSDAEVLAPPPEASPAVTRPGAADLRVPLSGSRGTLERVGIPVGLAGAAALGALLLGLVLVMAGRGDQQPG
jgi:D-alanyl-D-alanine carboxypeptidase (penicillin-binding protein 5/6)